MKRPSPRTRRLLGCTVALLVAACVVFLSGIVVAAGLVAELEVRSHQEVVLPRPTGPYRVGRAVFDWTDPSRQDPYAPDAAAPRELSVWVWYPADPPPGSSPAAYYPTDWIRAFGDNAPFHTSLSVIHANAVADAPVAGGQRYPVLVVAPGLGLAAPDYAGLIEELASWGYVVAGINPTYTIDVVLAGGRAVHSVDRARDDADIGQLVGLWAADMRFVTGRMQALASEPGGRFNGQLDPTRIGFFGHSAGGAAAVEACRADDRCAAATDLDGLLVGEAVRGGLGKPFLYIGHEDDLAPAGDTRAELRGVLQGAPSGQDVVLTVKGTGHLNFSDRGLYFNFLFAQLGALGSIDGGRALAITDRYLRAFYATYLLQNRDPLLSGPSPSYPEVRFESP